MKDPIINRYLNDKLTEEQEYALEKALMQAAFKQKYRQFSLDKGLYRPEDKVISPLKSLIFRKRTWLLAAAASVAILFLTVHNIPSKPAEETETLVLLVDKELQERFEAPVTRMSVAPVQETWEQAKQQYHAHQFEAAAAAFESIAPTESVRDSAIFYAGLCHLYQKVPDYPIAIGYFSFIIDKYLGSDKECFQEECLWFMALAHIKNGNLQEAQQRLLQFKATKTVFKQEEVALLLKKLGQ